MNQKRLIILKTDTRELILPITPQEYEIATQTDYKKTNIVSVGDVFIAGLEAAQTIKLMSFFPANEYSFANNLDIEPQKYIDAIEKLRTEETVFQLIISGTAVNLPVRVQSFIYGEQDGSNDVEYSVTFGIHRELETVEAAGWTIPKRKYEKPKQSSKNSSKSGSKNSSKSEKDRVPQDTYNKPVTIAHGYIVINGHRYNAANENEVV